MIPLVLQLFVWGALWAAGIFELPLGQRAVDALRVSFAVMFAFTGISHFVPGMRRDFIRMVPPRLPRPGLLVTISGVCELAGAAGLCQPVLVAPAALALALLLVVLLPANVRAHRAGLVIGGRAATPLRWRVPMQLFWIVALLWVGKVQLLASRTPSPAVSRQEPDSHRSLAALP
jgi:uncharacterized membrane protein